MSASDRDSKVALSFAYSQREEHLSPGGETQRCLVLSEGRRAALSGPEHSDEEGLPWLKLIHEIQESIFARRWTFVWLRRAAA